MPFKTGIGLMALGFAVAGAVTAISAADAPASTEMSIERVLFKSVGPPGHVKDAAAYVRRLDGYTEHFDWLAEPGHAISA
ncbi:hypothetical protein [Nocardia grenadensis]|uniref:hypothetical protein n=1 Tax=Nocardia grenadensis TaxID=931537 RepID=UPI001FE079A2|nr:hypothetical protein [Nocardia grenadensis]